MATEDSIFINKKVHKLSDLVYDYDIQYIDQIMTIKTDGLEKKIFSDLIEGKESKRKPNTGAFYCEFVPDYLNYKNNDFIVISSMFR